jgi:hypothetical protein
MTGTKAFDVETQLRQAGAAAAWPVTPDLRSAVLARIDAAGAGASGTAAVGASRPPQRSRRPVVAVAFALIALLVLAGVAGALGFRLPGWDVEFVESLPPAGSGLDLGSPIPLADARTLDRPRVLVPATMPEPDIAYVVGRDPSRIVTLAWRADPGDPTIPSSDLALTVMAAPGETNDGLIRKLVGPGTSLEGVTVGDERGWWMSGAPHEIFLVGPDGDVDMVTSALAGDTLVFVRDGTLYRLESALGRDATIAIAQSLR